MEQLAECFRVMIEEALDRCESFLGLAFHHVTGKGPRSTGKTQNGNLWTDGFHDPPDGLGQETCFRLRIEDLEPDDIRLGAHRIRQVWPGIAEFQLQAHGFGGEQKVPDTDYSIHPPP